MSFWNERYSEPGFAYGEAPNDFLLECVEHLPARRAVLSLGEGEGRNAVFLAQRGFEVWALDQSPVGLAKAERLASARSVTIHTIVADLSEYDLGEARWGAIVSVWCHLPSALRERVHRDCVRALEPGGVLVLEAYSPAQLAHNTGGPKSEDQLYSLAQLRSDLEGLEWIIGREVEREVHEGRYHDGLSATVQVVARKPLARER
jgi:SAM-dependent methyltransferase